MRTLFLTLPALALLAACSPPATETKTEPAAESTTVETPATTESTTETTTESTTTETTTEGTTTGEMPATGETPTTGDAPTTDGTTTPGSNFAPGGAEMGTGLDVTAIQALSSDAYELALNTNDVSALAAVLTDDVMFLAPGAPAVTGKEAVKGWYEGFTATHTATVDKTTTEFVVAGDWAFETYTYVSSATPKAGGEAMSETGKGIAIYKRAADGTWQVARDAWNSDAAPAAN